MGWTTPTQRSTGFLVTAAVYNTDIIDNLADRRGQAGVVVYEAGLISDTHNTDDLGSAAEEWKDIFGVRLHAGRQRFGGDFREFRLTWEARTYSISSGHLDETQADASVGTGGVITGGGSGQVALKTDLDATGEARVSQETEISPALDNAWTVSKRPWMRLEFSLSVEDTRGRVFIGFRTTPGNIAIPTTEHHAGIQFTGTEWQLTHSGGTQGTTLLGTEPTVGARNVIELYMNGSTDFEVWLNGVRDATIPTTNLPTSALEWDILLDTPSGSSTADDQVLTAGELLIQEDVP